MSDERLDILANAASELSGNYGPVRIQRIFNPSCHHDDRNMFTQEVKNSH